MMKNYLLSLLAIVMWCFMIWMLMFGMAEAAGQQCDWVSDCDLNETCAGLPFSSREPGDKTGICVPKEW